MTMKKVRGYGKQSNGAQAAIPMETCDDCGLQKPAYVFTSLAEKEGGPYRNICGFCYNRRYARDARIPELEVAEFPPLTLSDTLGKMHTFHFAVRFTTGLGIQAFEWIDQAPGGYQFAIMEHPETPVREVYARLLKKIEKGLAVRYIRSSDFEPAHNRLYIKGSAVNGRIEETHDGEPYVVVDGVNYTWKEFGRCLSSHMGFNFRLECVDPYEPIKTSTNPKRPDVLWWPPKRLKKDRTEPTDVVH